MHKMPQIDNDDARDLPITFSENSACFARNYLGYIPARFVLYFLSFTGFIVSFLIRSDINLTILAMVKEPPPSELTNTSNSYCHVTNEIKNNSNSFVDYGGTIEWSPDVQNYIITSFYWIYICTQIIGGEVTQKYGTKRVLGYAQLVTALCSLFIPWATEIHYGMVIMLRSVQGFASGFTWPAMYAIIGHWFPVHERSRFISSFQGYNLGTGLAYVVCGVIIANFGWKAVFYTTGSIGVCWCIIWYYLAFDSPEIHPRISSSEKQYIQENTISTSSIRQQKVPWVSILSSLPVWAMAITNFGRVWVLYTFTLYGPQYMKGVLGFNVEKNGVLSGLPFMLSYVSAVIFCYIGDKIIVHQVLTVTNTRKLFSAFSQIVPGLLCILLGYLGCNIIIILVVWFIAVTLLPGGFAGAMANIVDVAPNFSGPVLGFSQTILMSPSIFSPLLAGYLTRDGHTLSAWRKIFNISGGVSIFTYIIYHIWGTAEIQSWNYVSGSIKRPEDERMLQQQNTNENSTEIPIVNIENTRQKRDNEDSSV